mmetsp:Transcript_609/g.1105  ORF Transcript_609/g.1105 Transcript_609/m.1105 type:complete len:87 (-) Transcript_609:11-271(-)
MMVSQCGISILSITTLVRFGLDSVMDKRDRSQSLGKETSLQGHSLSFPKQALKRSSYIPYKRMNFWDVVLLLDVEDDMLHSFYLCI